MNNFPPDVSFRSPHCSLDLMITYSRSPLDTNPTTSRGSLSFRGFKRLSENRAERAAGLAMAGNVP
jgi:hypothetical protein